MLNSVTLTLGVGVFAVAGTLIGVGGETIRQKMFSPPQNQEIELIALVYENGKFGQEMRVKGDKPVRASWAAKITRAGTQICSGGGVAPYEPRQTGEKDWYTPDYWTGGKCPKLKTGDVARAVWEYTNAYGFIVSIHGEVVVEEK